MRNLLRGLCFIPRKEEGVFILAYDLYINEKILFLYGEIIFS